MYLDEYQRLNNCYFELCDCSQECDYYDECLDLYCAYLDAVDFAEMDEN